MNELTHAELSYLDDMMDHRRDHMRHYPDEFTELDVHLHDELQRKILDEAKRRNLWWGRRQL